jgi:hypothetical protein
MAEVDLLGGDENTGDGSLCSLFQWFLTVPILFILNFTQKRFTVRLRIVVGNIK